MRPFTPATLKSGANGLFPASVTAGIHSVKNLAAAPAFAENVPLFSLPPRRVASPPRA